tara:strand:- start:153 stop:596 length:444 start_codon:yes stop_codon:yes gene_type:complete
MKSKLTVERDVLFNSDLVTVHRVLLDTENYPKYIKDIKSAKVIYKKNDESEVMYKAKISFFSFEYSIKTTKVSENQITFEQKKGFFSFLNGEWRLKENNGKVEGKYIVNVKLPRFVAGKIVEKAINLYFPDMLNDFQNEIERRFKDG